MKVAIAFLAIIGLINASPLVQQSKARPAGVLRAPTYLPSGAVLSLECRADAFDVVVTYPEERNGEEVTIALGANNDLAIASPAAIPTECQASQQSENENGQKVFTFASRSFADATCPGALTSIGDNVQFTIAVSVHEAVFPIDEDLPFVEQLFSNVEASCIFTLGEIPEVAGNTVAEVVEEGASAEAPIPFILTASTSPTRGANRFEFTLAPAPEAIFPVGYTYNLVSCVSTPSTPATPADQRWDFLPAPPGVCAAGVIIEEIAAVDATPRSFLISTPAHRFKGQTGTVQSAVNIDCTVRLCDETDCAPRTCPTAPVIEPEVEGRTKTASSKVAQPKPVKIAPGVKGKVTLLK